MMLTCQTHAISQYYISSILLILTCKFTMKLSLSLLCFLPAFVAGVVRDDKIPTSLNEICSNLINGALGRIVPGLGGTEDSALTCTCEPSLFPSVAIEFGCETTEPVCLPENIVCGIPSVSVALDVTDFIAGEKLVSFDVCFSEIFILEVIPVIELLGPLCFSLIRALLGSDAKKVRKSPGAAGKARRAWACSGATYGGQECKSCSVCDGGSGFIFDCTNIDSNLVSSTCSGSMNLPTTIDDVYHPEAIGMPMLDVAP